jgi:hypothetical protein
MSNNCKHHHQQLNNDSDDDDIIAIRERKGQSLVSTELEDSQCFSPSQQKLLPHRRHRRRPQHQQPEDNNESLLSQIKIHHDTTHIGGSLQDSGMNAFESLESLLEDQTLSLSLTQEHSQPENPSTRQEIYEGKQSRDVPMQMGPEDHPTEDRKQQSLLMPPPSQPKPNPQMEQENNLFEKSISDTYHPDASFGRNAVEDPSAGNKTEINPQSSHRNQQYNDTTFASTDQENDTWIHTTDNHQDISNITFTLEDPADDRNNSLERELKRQRKEIKKKKTRQESQSTTGTTTARATLPDPLQPNQSLQQRLQKERKNRRSKPSDHYHHNSYKRDRSTRSTSPPRLPHPYKRERSSRSTSPLPRPSSSRRPTSSPQIPSKPVEKAKNSLVGFRYVNSIFVCGFVGFWHETLSSIDAYCTQTFSLGTTPRKPFFSRTLGTPLGLSFFFFFEQSTKATATPKLGGGLCHLQSPTIPSDRRTPYDCGVFEQ